MTPEEVHDEVLNLRAEIHKEFGDFRASIAKEFGDFKADVYKTLWITQLSAIGLILFGVGIINAVMLNAATSTILNALHK